MSAKVQGKRPEIIDLTKRASAFQPHTGAKKFVIKNLRTTSRAQDVEDYYRRTWAELDTALTAIFSSSQPRQPLERLYRGVEDLCRSGQAEKVYDMLRQRCEDHLHGEVLQKIKADGGNSNVDMLRSVYKHWKTWNAQSVNLPVSALENQN